MSARPPRLPFALPFWAFVVMAFSQGGLADPGHPVAARSVDFNRDVRPILAKTCFSCHGADEKHREGGLRLDVREAAVKPLADGKTAIVPGHADQSELVRRITAKGSDDRMPPADAKSTLTKEQTEILTQWIAEGAPYSRHWSFEKPVRPKLPHLNDIVDRPEWPANPIDLFVAAKLLDAGLTPSPPADAYVLIRRLSLDLRGLPPTPEEVDEFARDADDWAYERLVDRFLADPAFGERWARPWLDLARYADSAGYASDPLRTIWLYRDWVINAFNVNMPFDQFTVEQLAGDLLPNPTTDQLVATAFNRNTMTNTEGGTDDEEFRVAAVKDRVDTTMDVWMGLTIGCAKCHSHKFDPITQAEYYQFFAIFNQTADNDQPNESPTISFPSPAAAGQREAIDAQIAALKKRTSSKKDPKLAARIAKLNRSKPRDPSVPVMRELPRDKNRETHVMIKGNFLVPAEAVGPGVPAFFGALPKGPSSDRLAMARWLVDRNNPLTARVAVNRIWSQIFGQGIVETEEDFGTQGRPPSHPELLDYLAVEYQQHGWDTKALIRRLVTSATYRQSSRETPEVVQKDSANRLYSRAPRFRMEAEMVRDQALALSGLLSQRMKGPSVFPPQPDGLWRAAFNGSDRTWATSPGAEAHRRGLYTFWRRTIPYPSMTTFDAPSREVCSVRRVRTNTPLQAFVTLNDPVYVEAAQALSRRIMLEGGLSPRERCRFALRLCLARPPKPEQVAELEALLLDERRHYQADLPAARALAVGAEGTLPAGLDAADLAAWTVVANVLLNLDGVLTKG
ncbi:MAG TPA: PSD1 and planctomycete cytochrome C domain-containing protein [Planctomycetaceae bacterium]|nr:PSD1 and planctomycete cytochrome C domain-containing protein [Planctomycetaceae bacterium]